MAFFRRVWFHYFYSTLTLVFLSMYPAFRYRLADPSRYPAAQRLRRRWLRITFRLTGLRMQIEGLEKLDLDRTYVIAGNHGSELDVGLLCAALPLYLGFMAKADLQNTPLLNIFFDTLDIPVERESEARSATSFRKALLALREGRSLVIFPEGGIIAGPELLKPFKEGAFQIAIRAGVPILPVSMPDNVSTLPDGIKRGKPGKIRLILHTPVETTGLKPADAGILKDQVFATIEKAL